MITRRAPKSPFDDAPKGHCRFYLEQGGEL